MSRGEKLLEGALAVGLLVAGFRRSWGEGFAAFVVVVVFGAMALGATGPRKPTWRDTYTPDYLRRDPPAQREKRGE